LPAHRGQTVAGSAASGSGSGGGAGGGAVGGDADADEQVEALRASLTHARREIARLDGELTAGPSPTYLSKLNFRLFAPQMA